MRTRVRIRHPCSVCNVGGASCRCNVTDPCRLACALCNIQYVTPIKYAARLLCGPVTAFAIQTQRATVLACVAVTQPSTRAACAAAAATAQTATRPLLLPLLAYLACALYLCLLLRCAHAPSARALASRPLAHVLHGRRTRHTCPLLRAITILRLLESACARAHVRYQSKTE